MIWAQTQMICNNSQPTNDSQQSQTIRNRCQLSTSLIWAQTQWTIRNDSQPMLVRTIRNDSWSRYHRSLRFLYIDDASISSHRLHFAFLHISDTSPSSVPTTLRLPFAPATLRLFLHLLIYTSHFSSQPYQTFLFLFFLIDNYWCTIYCCVLGIIVCCIRFILKLCTSPTYKSWLTSYLKLIFWLNLIRLLKIFYLTS